VRRIADYRSRPAALNAGGICDGAPKGEAKGWVIILLRSRTSQDVNVLALATMLLTHVPAFAVMQLIFNAVSTL
jgi:hypothetical protein